MFGIVTGIHDLFGVIRLVICVFVSFNCLLFGLTFVTLFALGLGGLGLYFDCCFCFVLRDLGLWLLVVLDLVGFVGVACWGLWS